MIFPRGLAIIFAILAFSSITRVLSFSDWHPPGVGPRFFKDRILPQGGGLENCYAEDQFQHRWSPPPDRRFSSAEECNRECKDGEKPRECYYKFVLQYHITMGGPCQFCKPNDTNQLTNVPQCQCIIADGYERVLYAINRMLPGPSIQVCQGDKIIVDVINKLHGQETAIHWHGVFQKGYQYYDGVPFVTQCPIPSGTTFRYAFQANNPGTLFYHAHSGVQKLNGLYGALIIRQTEINEPHREKYDFDLPVHIMLISDWMHDLAEEHLPGKTDRDPGQLPQTNLINGKGQWTDPITNKSTDAPLQIFEIVPGNRYRFRMINSFSTVCSSMLTVEGHNLSVIAMDGEAVEPVSITTITSSSGERFDFILTADQKVKSYWIELKDLPPCDLTRAHQVAILRYKGAPDTPESPRPTYTSGLPRGIVLNPVEADCDAGLPDVICVHQLSAVSDPPKRLLNVEPDQQTRMPFKIIDQSGNQEKLFTPGSYPDFLVAEDKTPVQMTMDTISDKHLPSPPLSQPPKCSDMCNRNNLPPNCTEPCDCTHVIHVKKNVIYEMIIYDQVPSTLLGHPFHLHGYAFYLLKIGRFPGKTEISSDDITGVLNEHRKKLQSSGYDRPPRKDTVMVPMGGYAIFRILSDNPGWWFLHCHFVFHIDFGMGLIIQVGDRKDLPPVPPNLQRCGNVL